MATCVQSLMQSSLNLRAPRSPMGPVRVYTIFGLFLIPFIPCIWLGSGHCGPTHISKGKRRCYTVSSISNTLAVLSMANWVLFRLAPRSPIGHVSVNIKFVLLHFSPDMLITRFVHRSRMVCARPQLTIHPPSSLSHVCGSRLHSFLSPMTVLTEVNAVLSSFDADVAHLRDMALNRLIFYPSPDLNVVLYTISERTLQRHSLTCRDM